VHKKSQIVLFLGAVTLIAAAAGVHDSIFGNFLADVYSMKAEGRGWLELPREWPGLMLVLMTGVLCMLPIARLGVAGAAVYAAGIAGMALFGTRPMFWPMMVMMVVASAGMHLLQPVSQTLAIALGDESSRGRRLGRMGAMRSVGTIIGALFVYLVFDKVNPQYRLGFLCAAGAAGVGAMLYGLMHVPPTHQPRARLVFRGRYKLYYLLEFLFGARKQIFITFGPWVLIKVYGRPATSIAALLLVAAAIGLVFKPLSGWAIDRFG